jgi:uncharacterized protein
MRRSRKPFRGFLLRRGFESLPLRFRRLETVVRTRLIVVELLLEAATGTSFGTVGLVVSDAMIVDAGQRLAPAARSPARVVLFGSRARGDAREDSDLDFLVIEEHLDSKLSEMVRLRDALPPLAVPVDVVVVSEEEVARRSPVPSTLVHRALRAGRILVPAC